MSSVWISLISEGVRGTKVGTEPEEAEVEEA